MWRYIVVWRYILVGSKGYGRKKLGTQCYIFWLRTLEAHSPSPTCQKRQFSDQSERSTDPAGCATCVTPHATRKHLILLFSSPSTFSTTTYSESRILFAFVVANQPPVGFSNRPWHDKWYCNSFISKFQSPQNLGQTHS